MDWDEDILEKIIGREYNNPVFWTLVDFKGLPLEDKIIILFMGWSLFQQAYMWANHWSQMWKGSVLNQ